MKAMWKWTAVAVIGLVVGGGLTQMLNAKAKSRLVEQVRSLQSELDEVRAGEAKATAQRDRWQSEAERLRKQGDEVHRLRAEIGRLTADLEATKRVVETKLAHESKRAEIPNAQAARVEKGVKGEPPDGFIPVENAPAAVASVILREFENAPIRGISVRNREGQLTYTAKGQLPDGRGLALSVREDGTLLERHAEVPKEVVPSPVQSALAQTFGEVAISGARQVVDENMIRYELVSKTPESTMEMVVREDGTILGYSAKLRSPGEPVKKAK